MKRLPIPDERTMQAMCRLEGMQDWQIVKAWLMDLSPAYIVERFKARRDTMEDLLDKGALQTIDDLNEAMSKSTKWLGDITLLNKKKREGI